MSLENILNISPFAVDLIIEITIWYMGLKPNQRMLYNLNRIESDLERLSFIINPVCP